MSFTYLHVLRTDKEGIVARVSSDSFMDLGTANSRLSRAPIACFQLDKFEGLDEISDNDLWAEIERRFTPDEIRHRLNAEATFDELIDELKRVFHPSDTKREVTGK